MAVLDSFLNKGDVFRTSEGLDLLSVSSAFAFSASAASLRALASARAIRAAATLGDSEVARAPGC